MDSGRIAEYAALLGGVAIFAGLDRVTLAKLAAHLEPVPIADGATLFRQGDPPDALYLISRGTFGIFGAAAGGSGEIRLATRSRGDPIGEMALLTGDVRSATVRAEGDGEVLRLDRAHFLDLVGRDPSVALAIAATLSRRLREADARCLGAPDSVAPEAQGAAGPPTGPATIKPGVAAAVAPARRRRRPDRAAVGLLLAGTALAVGWVAPPPEGLSPAGWRALATLLALVPLLALEALPDAAVALVLAAAWVLGGVAPAQVALGGFATGAWLLVVSILAVGAAIAECGLLYRLALWAVARARGGFPGQVLALGLAGLVAGAAVPHAVGRISLIAPALAEVAEALGYAPRSRAAAGLAMAALVGFGQMVAPFLTSSSAALLAYALLPAGSRAGLDWGTWALRAAPLHGVLFAGLVAVVVWLYRPGRRGEPGPPAARDPSQALALQRALLGPPTGRERVASLAAAFLLAGFVTQPLHGVEPAWVGAAAFALLGATGLLTAETLRAVNWSFVLLFGVLAGAAGVFAGSGLDRWLAGLAAGTVHGLVGVPILFVGALALLCCGVSFVLRWVVAVPILVIALGPVAAAAGIDPWVVAIVVLVAGNGFFLPYQSTIYLALYHGTGGQLFDHGQARPLAIAYWVLTLLGLCASVPIWHAMGLL